MLHCVSVFLVRCIILMCLSVLHYFSVFECVAVCSSVDTCCSVLVCFSALQYISVFECVAVCSSVDICCSVSVCCSALHYFGVFKCVAVSCKCRYMLQCLSVF